MVKFPCLSCYSASSNQSTGSSLFCLPRALVAWNWFINLIQWLLSMLRIGCKGACVGNSVSCLVGRKLGILSCTYVTFHTVPGQPQDMSPLPFLLWNEGGAASNAMLWALLHKGRMPAILRELSTMGHGDSRKKCCTYTYSSGKITICLKFLF